MTLYKTIISKQLNLLKTVLLKNNESSSSSANDNVTQPASQGNVIPIKRRCFLAPISDTETNRICDPDRIESIHKALAKLLSMNQLPL